jgi:hypothetical protein
MVKKEYCIKQLHNEALNCFVIYDKDMNMVARQNRNVTLKDAEEALNEFFENADSGVYTVKLYAFKDQSKNGQPVLGKYLHCDIHHIPSLKEKDPLPPVPGYSGAGGLGALEQTNGWIDRFLGGKDEITGLRLELEKDRIRNEYEARIREMEAEHNRKMAEKENRWEERIMGIASTIAPDLLKGFGGGKPMAGFPETETETEIENNMTTTPEIQKKRIIDAVNKLMALDSNLAENLERLAKMAETNPQVYRQAVNILKTMS